MEILVVCQCSLGQYPIFESRLGKTKIEEFIKSRADYAIALNAKDDFFTAEEIIEVSYYKYGQKYLGDLIITKIRESVA